MQDQPSDLVIQEDNEPKAPRYLRIENAQQFLLNNPAETIACAARIYDLSEQTLYTAIRRSRSKLSSASTAKNRGSRYKILDDHQVEAIHGFNIEAEIGIKDDEAEKNAIRDQDDFIAFEKKDDDIQELIRKLKIKYIMRPGDLITKQLAHA